MKGYILPAVKIGHPMILRDLMGDWKADEPRKATVSRFIEKETRARISAAIKLLSYKERLSR